MQIEYNKILVEESIKLILEYGINYFKNLFSEKKEDFNQFSHDFRIGISNHLIKALNFADRITNFRLAEPKKTNKYSIELTLKSQVRRFTPLADKSRQILKKIFCIPNIVVL